MFFIIMVWFCCFSKNYSTECKINKSIKIPQNIIYNDNVNIYSIISKELVIEQLKNIEYKDTKIFYNNIIYCKCVKVYDGDTITIATMVNHNTILPNVYRFSIRLNGIDAPEIKSDTINEKKYAINSRDMLSNKILGKIIRLEIIEKPEKWGRILANVFLDDENICQWLLDNKLAIPYFGKTKIKSPEWLDNNLQ